MVFKSGIVKYERQNEGDRLMEKVDATIAAILEAHGTPVHRTKLVKLVYIIDELYHEHFGQTITGLRYMWAEFGPNAIGNAIVWEADRLATKGIVHIKPYPNYYGETSYLYSLEQAETGLEEILSEAERYVIRDVVAHYAKYGVRDIVRASKQTESFKGTEKYGIITLKKSAEYERLLQDVKSDPEFTKGIEEAVQVFT